MSALNFSRTLLPYHNCPLQSLSFQASFSHQFFPFYWHTAIIIQIYLSSLKHSVTTFSSTSSLLYSLNSNELVSVCSHLLLFLQSNLISFQPYHSTEVIIKCPPSFQIHGWFSVLAYNYIHNCLATCDTVDHFFFLETFFFPQKYHQSKMLGFYPRFYFLFCIVHLIYQKIWSGPKICISSCHTLFYLC